MIDLLSSCLVLKPFLTAVICLYSGDHKPWPHMNKYMPWVMFFFFLFSSSFFLFFYHVFIKTTRQKKFMI